MPSWQLQRLTLRICYVTLWWVTSWTHDITDYWLCGYYSIRKSSVEAFHTGGSSNPSLTDIYSIWMCFFFLCLQGCSHTTSKVSQNAQLIDMLSPQNRSMSLHYNEDNILSNRALWKAFELLYTKGGPAMASSGRLQNQDGLFWDAVYISWTKVWFVAQVAIIQRLGTKDKEVVLALQP